MIIDKLTSGGEPVKKPDGEVVHTGGSGWNTLIDLFKLRPHQITESNAYQFEDVYACINVLSDDLAKLPLKHYQRQGKKLTRISDDNIARLISKEPNDRMNPFVFKKLMMTDVLTGGNFYALLEFNNTGDINRIMPLDASKTAPAVTTTGQFVYVTYRENKEFILHSHEVIHIKGYSNDGLVGRSPIEVLRHSAESNMSATDYNKQMMQNGGLPKGVLSIAGSLSKESKKRVKEEWVNVNGSDAIAVLDSGMEYNQMSMSQKDMEFIESQKYNQQKIAAIYKVPLHKLNNLDRATFSNIEHQSLQYVKNTLQPWIVQIEEELNRKLFTLNKQTRGHYVKFNLDSELRGDAESRAKVQEIKLRNGFLTVNEGRAQDEYGPFEDLEIADKPLITLNYTPLERLVEYQYQGVTHLPVPSENPDNPDSDAGNGNETDEEGGETDE